jgi:hypothetical protein
VNGRRVMAVLALAGAALVALLVPGTAHPTRQGADAGFTYGYLPSILGHGNLDFSDDSLPFDSVMPHTTTGRTGNSFAIGPSVWWSPAFLAADGIGAAARVVSGDGRPRPDGRTWPYDALVGLAAIALGVAGLWIVFLAARMVAPPWAAAVGTLAVWLAGPLLYYTHVNPMQGHAAGMTASAALLLAWLRTRQRPDPSLARVACLGLLGGLLALTRWQDVLLLLGPVVDALTGALRRSAGDEPRRRPDLAAAAVLTGSAVIAFLPQLIVWNTLFGAPLRPPRGETSGIFLDASRLHLLDVLVSWRHGMLSWHPVLAVGLVGLALFPRRHRPVAVALAASFLLLWLVNATTFDWWGWVAFGARRFDGAWPALALGAAVVASRLPRWAAIAGAVALSAWNWILLNAFAAGLVPGTEAVRPGDLLHVLGRIPIAPGLHSWSPQKAVWVVGVATLAVFPAAAARLLPSTHGSTRRWRAVAAGAFAAALLVSGVVALAGRNTPARFEPTVLEAGYFVSQPLPPKTTDPGYLEPGAYVVSATGLRGAGTLDVRVGGVDVVHASAPLPEISRSPAVELRRGVFLVELQVTGAPVHLDAVRLRRVRPPVGASVLRPSPYGTSAPQ